MPIPTSETFKFQKYFSESYVEFKSMHSLLDEEQFEDHSNLSWSSCIKESEASFNRSARLSLYKDCEPSFNRSGKLSNIIDKYLKPPKLKPLLEPKAMEVQSNNEEVPKTAPKERKSRIPVLKSRLQASGNSRLSLQPTNVKTRRDLSFNDSGVCHSFSSSDLAFKTSTPERSSQRRVSFSENPKDIQKISRAHPNPHENAPAAKKPKISPPTKTKSILKKPEPPKPKAGMRTQKRSEDFLRWRAQKISTKDETIQKANINWDIKPISKKVSELSEREDSDDVRADIESLRQTLEKITSFLDTKFGDKM